MSDRTDTNTATDPTRADDSSEQESALATALCLLDTFAGEGLGHTYGNGQQIDADTTVHALCSAFYMEPDAGWYRDLAAQLAPLPCKSGEGAGARLADRLRNRTKENPMMATRDRELILEAAAALTREAELVAALSGLELTEDGYSLRVAYDGDADDDGRAIAVGGETVVTFVDSDEGEAVLEAILAFMPARAALNARGGA